MESEQPIRIVRQHPLVLAPYLLLLLACLPIALGIVGPRPAMVLIAACGLAADLYGAGGRHPLRRIVLWTLLLAAGLIASLVVPALVLVIAVAATVLTAHWLDWHFRTYTLTDRRVVTRRGVLTQVGESYWLNRIQHVRVRLNLLNRVAGFGDVEIWVSGRGTMLLRQIVDVEDFHRQLLNAMEAKGGGRTRWQVPVPDYTPGPVWDSPW
jgi:membrane protein YdbS with pleckstrin-like domain